MALSDTAIFLIFLATLISAIALLFFLRKFIPDCREKKRKAKVCETTKIDKDDYKKRKFDLDLECGRSVESGEKPTKNWWDSLESLGRKDSKAGRGLDCQNSAGEKTRESGASTSTSNIGKGDEKQSESEAGSPPNETDNAPYTHVTSALEGVSPKTLEHDQGFDDVPLGSPQSKDMLDEWEAEKW